MANLGKSLEDIQHEKNESESMSAERINYLTSSIYTNLKHEMSSSEQDKGDGYLGLITQVLDQISASPIAFTESQLEALNRAKTGLTRNFGSGHVFAYRSFPQYACVLIISPLRVVDPGDLDTCGYSIHLLGLDNWDMHPFCVIGNKSIHHSEAAGHKVYHLGKFESRKRFLEMLEIFEEIYRENSRKKGDERNAASGDNGGHQKTPSFIHACLEKAIKQTPSVLLEKKTDEKLNFSISPKGGMTDVGLHTGGKARNVAWPLIRETFRYLLDNLEGSQFAPSDSKILFDKFMFSLHLFVFNKTIDIVREKKDINAYDLDGLMEVLTVMGDFANSINDCFEIVTQGRSKVDEICENFAKSRFESKILKDDHGIIHPELCVPSLLSSIKGSESFESIRKRALENIGQLLIKSQTLSDSEYVFADLDAPFTELLSWMRSYDSLDIQNSVSVSEKILLVLSTVDQLIAVLGLSLLDSGWSPDDQEIRDAHEVMKKYYLLIEAVETEFPDFAVNLRSMEMLNTWVMTCLLHSHVCKTTPMIQNYKLPLDPCNLQYLVLKNKVTWDLASIVFQYLKTVEKGAVHSPIFEIGDDAGTNSFSLYFALSQKHILNRLEKERAYAKTKEDAWFQSVLKKQKELEYLDERFSSENASLAEARHEFNTVKKHYDSVKEDYSYQTNPYRSKYDRINSSVSNLKSSVNYTRNQIEVNEKAPTFVIHALPEDKNKALVVIFHLFFISVEIEYLSRLIFAAQEMLFKNRKGFHKGPEYVTSWSSHYNGQFSIERERHSILFPAGYRLPTQFGPKNVRSIKSSSAGQWYPDYNSRLALPSELNPFIFLDGDRENISTFYTDKIRSDYQWCIKSPATIESSSNRGNLAYSKKIVKYLKSEHISIGALRSFPMQQIRKLIHGIDSGILPLGDSDVAKVVQIALFNIGELQVDGSFLWKEDLFKSDGSGFKALYDTLSHRADNLRDAPSKHQVHLVLGEIASFCMQYEDMLYPDCKDLVIEFAKMSQNWAFDNLDRAIKGAATSSRAELASLKAKAHLFFGYSICCFNIPRNSEMVSKIVKNLILFRLYQNFVSDMDQKVDGHLQDQCRNIKPRVHLAMSKLINSMMSVINFLERAKFNELLTGVIRSVFEYAPSNLSWERIGNSCCFEAIEDSSQKKSHYSVNVFTGVILYDGAPPCRLPTQILHDPLYQSFFGKHREFAVSVSKDHIFQSLAPLDGYFYQFSTHFSDETKKSHLKIIEIDENGKIELELLDFQGRLTWWPDLPIRLKFRFCHWFHASSGSVIMRPIFHDSANGQVNRQIHAFAVINDEQKVAFDIPTSFRDKHWSELLNANYLESYEKLQCNLEIFSSFERSEYIHVFQCRESAKIRVHLPRFNLSFIKDKHSPHFKCKELPEYSLATKQVFKDSFSFFEHYLLLESENDTRLLVPCGTTSKNSVNMVRILLDRHFGSIIPYFVYDLNKRTGFFSSNSIAAQLHWAAILTVSGCQVCDPLMGMTGSEAAMTILRQCFCSRPLSQLELDRLNDIILNSYREPGLIILCHELLYNASYVSFLYGEKQMVEIEDWCTNAVTEYNSLLSCMRLNSRRLVNEDESSCLCIKKGSWNFRVASKTLLVGPENSVSSTFVTETEDILLSTIIRSKSTITSPFPISNGAELHSSALNDVFIGDLKTSWKKNHTIPSERIDDFGTLSKKLNLIKLEVNRNLGLLEQYFKKISHEILTYCAKMELAINRMPKWGFRDLLIFVRYLDDKDQRTHKDFLRLFFPSLSDSSIEHFKEAAIKYLELCILKDKLGRIDSRIKVGQCDDILLLRELKCKRLWDPRKYPRWLVFEAESSIQIRPEQYKIAKHLLENPGSICQLNMGYGKTRVIAPMLVIEMTKSEDRIVRLFILSAVLNEAIDYMQETMMIKSVLQVRVFTQPFSREIKLDKEMVQRTRFMADFARKSGGFFILAPEHKLSMELKVLETIISGGEKDVVEQLRLITNSNLYYDILDEADELLSYKYQLVYAIESSLQKRLPLEDGRIRWTAAQALLNVLSNNKKIAAFLDAKSESISRGFHIQANDCINGRFRDIRLIDALSEKQKQGIQELKVLLLKELIDNPPRELSWMKEISDILIPQEIFMKCMVDMTIDPEEYLADYQAVLAQNPEYFLAVLAFRGLLGCGLLKYCLQLRYRVDYGLDPKRKKSLAVPFKAADIPSNRSEFSHPDVGIVKTILSYYHTGLTREQVLDASKLLVSLGPIAQKRIYMTWYHRMKDNIISDDRAKLDSHEKIDVTNSSQVRLIYDTFRFCMETIDFWMNNFVFPKDTGQYPFRIVKSAFDLAHKEAVGFSGTKDMRLLHPISMSQMEPNDDYLIGTDGKMLFLLMEKSCYKSLPAKGDAVWKSLLQMALDQKVHALIDAGSLLAGVLNNDASRFLRDLLRHSNPLHFRGIIYFEPKSERKGGEWMVLHLETDEIMRKADSPIHDSEALIIFDDARTRGADMKMSPKAKALLSLGPNLTKDKLMQSAGRLRQLEGGQGLIITATIETETQIRMNDTDEGILLTPLRNYSIEPPIQVTSILKWALDNTEKETVKGLSQWASNGMIYDRSKNYEDNALIKEDWSLKTLYQTTQKKSMLSEVIRRKGNSMLEDLNIQEHPMEFLESVFRHTARYGETIEVVENNADHGEECEREMQLEVEQEKEKEVEGIDLCAVVEEVWSYASILNFKTIKEVQRHVQVIEFSKMSCQSPEIKHLVWSSKLFGTVNFFSTIAKRNWLDMAHARVIDCLLVFDSGVCLALSDQEAEGVLRGFMLNPSARPGFVFVNQSRLMVDGLDLALGNCDCLLTAQRLFSLNASLELFNGISEFKNESVLSAVKMILKDPKSKKQIENLVQTRGLYHFYSLSQLQKICKTVSP